MCVKVEAKSTSHLCSTHVTGHGNSILHQSEPKHLRILHSFSCGIDLQSVSDTVSGYTIPKRTQPSANSS